MSFFQEADSSLLWEQLKVFIYTQTLDSESFPAMFSKRKKP